jgi:hypothetical protein
MTRITGHHGLSLVEVTIMLLVLMLLTSVLAPSIWDFVHDAQWVKVKEDCEAIGISFSRLTRDVGPCLRVNSLNPCTKEFRVDVLSSQGGTVPIVGPTATAFVSPNMNSSNWNAAGASNWDTMESQFVTNAPGYRVPLQNHAGSGTYPVGPLFGLGWRGPYLSSPIGPDPWGSKYYVNAGFFAVATDASAASEGALGWWWARNVVCLSAGPDQTISSPFAQAAIPGAGTNRLGDDFIFVISGSGR